MSNVFDGLEQALRGKPDGSKTLYKVYWGIQYDSPLGGIIGNRKSDEIFKNYKFFTDKDKAVKLKAEIDAAFKVLGLLVEGKCYIKEDYYED